MCTFSGHTYYCLIGYQFSPFSSYSSISHLDENKWENRVQVENDRNYTLINRYRTLGLRINKIIGKTLV